MSRRLPAVAMVGLLALASATGAAEDARAQQAPSAAPAEKLSNPSTLPQRRAIFAWDKDLLRASFSFRDVADAFIAEKLKNGISSVIVMRAYVFEDGRTEPVALAARTCSVAYDLWDEVYRVKITDPAGERNVAVINAEGVTRRCTEAQDFPIVARSLLKKAKPYFLGVIVEVNPISEATLQQIRQWVSRPMGSTGIGTGDALFGSTVGLFVRDIGTADRTLIFRTQAFASTGP
jgi:hypothetical protein